MLRLSSWGHSIASCPFQSLVAERLFLGAVISTDHVRLGDGGIRLVLAKGVAQMLHMLLAGAELRHAHDLLEVRTGEKIYERRAPRRARSLPGGRSPKAPVSVYLWHVGQNLALGLPLAKRIFFRGKNILLNCCNAVAAVYTARKTRVVRVLSSSRPHIVFN